MIAIIDYGLGNVLAFANLYHRFGIPARIAKTAAELEGATRLILPGVGAFDHAMERLETSGMRDRATELVRERGVPVLGICVGMQILADASDEGALPGLGWIPGRVRKLDVAALKQKTQLPHMGWNDVEPVRPSPLFAGLEQDARFYFLHSYYFHCARREDTLAETDYGIRFSCAVNAGGVYGVQFHPEKSHHFGAQLLKNFAEMQ
jgi:imidazole glycerol-phosphate synthase subunit HisH